MFTGGAWLFCRLSLSYFLTLDEGWAFLHEVSSRDLGHLRWYKHRAALSGVFFGGSRQWWWEAAHVWELGLSYSLVCVGD